MATELERLLSKLQQGSPEDCWNWTGCTTGNGYGVFCLTRRKREVAHRAAYRLLVGPIPEGYILHHACANRRCCNPDHLVLTTLREHTFIDPSLAAMTGRDATHCLRGHEFTPENTRLYKGYRWCRACEFQRWKARSKGQVNWSDRTHCPAGHPYDETNTYHGTDGARHCRACRRVRSLRYYHARKAR